MRTVALAAGLLLVTALTAAPVPVPQPDRPDPMGSGFVGVKFTTGRNNSGHLPSVEETMPGLPAQLAGMGLHDIILRVGTTRVRTIDETISAVSAYRPGALIEIEVQREELDANSERVFVKVVLKCRLADRYDQVPHAPSDDK